MIYHYLPAKRKSRGRGREATLKDK